MGWFEGEVKYAHVLGTKGPVLFRVLYPDGDCEDLEMCVVKKCLLPVENNVCKTEDGGLAATKTQSSSFLADIGKEDTLNDVERPKPCRKKKTPAVASSMSCDDVKGNIAAARNGDQGTGNIMGTGCASSSAATAVSKTTTGESDCSKIGAINSDPVEMLNIAAQAVIEGFEYSQQNVDGDIEVAVVDTVLLARLHSAVIAANHLGGGQISAIESNTLQLVLQALENHIHVMCSFPPLLSRELSSRENALDIARTVHTGLEASAVALYILTARNINSCLIGDEMIDGCLLLLRNYASALRVCFDPSRSETTSDRKAISEDSSTNNCDLGRKKGARKKPQHHVTKEEENLGCNNIAIMHKWVLDGSGRVCEVLGLWERLLRSTVLQHKVIMSLCSSCLDILALDPSSYHAQDVSRLPPLQCAAIGVLVAVFATHGEHRLPLIEDCVGLLPRLSTSKKYLRLLSCQWPHEGSSIQMVSALKMCFIQALSAENEVSAARTSCSQLIHHLLGRCGICIKYKDSGTPALSMVEAEEAAGGAEMSSSYRNLVGFMVDDWIAVLPAPEWPASEMLIGALSADLVEVLRDYSNHSVLTTQFSLDTLGRIAARVTGLMRDERLDPVPLVFHNKNAEMGGGSAAMNSCSSSSPSALMDGKEPEEGHGGVVCMNCHRVFTEHCSSPDEEEGIKNETSSSTFAPHHRINEWTCRNCSLSQQVLDHRLKLAKRRESMTQGGDDVNLERLREMEMYLEKCSNNEEMEKTTTNAGAAEVVEVEEEMEAAASVEEKDILRQLILNTIADSAMINSWSAEARLTLVYMWADKEDSERRAAHWKHQKVVEKAIARRSSRNIPPVLTHSELIKASRRLLLSVTGNGEGLSSGLDALLSHFLLLLGANTVVLRARAVKALGGVIAADHDIMLKDSIHKALRLRFYDEAISVREAVVNLVGTYLLQDHQYKVENNTTPHKCRNLLDKYLEPLMERLLDKGVSVRKSVVKILRGALLADPTHPSRSFVCHSLVERASILKEEESIRNLIHATFCELWFVNDNASQDVIEATTVHMMEVVVGMGSTTEWFVNLLKGILVEDTNQPPEDRATAVKSGSSSMKKLSINGGRDDGGMLSCQAIVKCVMNFMLLMDEGTFVKLHAGKFSLDSDLNDPEMAYLAGISLLSAFCQCRALLLVDHIDGLYHYLPSRGKMRFSTGLEGQLCFLISGMIKSVLPLLRQPDFNVMDVVSHNLVSAAHRYGSQAVDAAIECLVKIAEQVSKDYGHVDCLLTKCFKNLLYVLRNGEKVSGGDTCKEQQSTVSGVIAHVQRSLVIVGSICRYRPLSGSVDDVVSLTSSVSSSPTHLKQLYEVLRLHAFPPETSNRNDGRPLNSISLSTGVQAKGLAGLISLLIGSPRYMLLAEKEGIIKRALSSESQRVLEQALTGLSEVLKVGEARVESGEAREAMASSGVSTADRVQGDQDAEASVASGVIQMHVDNILRNVLHEQPSVRTAAVKLLAVILNQGLMNPQDAMASLLALQGDVENPTAQQVALKEVLLRDDRNPNFLQSKLADGVALAFHFQHRILGPTRALGLLPADSPQAIERGFASIFSPIYATCLRPTRRARQFALRVLVDLFGRGTLTDGVEILSGKKNTELDALDAGMISFLGHTLAYLP